MTIAVDLGRKETKQKNIGQTTVDCVCVVTNLPMHEEYIVSFIIDPICYGNVLKLKIILNLCLFYFM